MVQTFVLFSLLGLGTACSWAPHIETSIYEGPQGSVFLTTVSDESFKANHPVTIQTDTLAKILRGIHVRPTPRLLQKIFSGESTPEPLFTEEQIHALAPQLNKAFAQVTPEEQIVLKTRGHLEKDAGPIHAIMFVQNHNLHIHIAVPSQSSHASLKSKNRGVLSYQEGVDSPTLVFFPQSALRNQTASHWLLGDESKNNLVINLPHLASLPEDIPKNDTMHFEPNAAQSPSFSNTKTSAQGPSAIAAESQQQSSPPLSPDAKRTDQLLKEMKALRDELAEQKKLIEELKQNKE